MPKKKRHEETVISTHKGDEVVAAQTKHVKRSRKTHKKAPGAPRRFKTAFIFFSTAKHKEIRQKLGPRGTKQKTPNIAKMVGEAWRNLSKEERAAWDEIAAKDKARFELEKRVYKGPWQVPNEKNEGGRVDPKAPRRPCSAFVTFLNCKRAEMKKTHPDASPRDVMRIGAKMWHASSPEDRRQHLQREARALEKYKKELKEWHESKPEMQLAARREEMAWMALEAQEKQEKSVEAEKEDESTCQTTESGSNFKDTLEERLCDDTAVLDDEELAATDKKPDLPLSSESPACKDHRDSKTNRTGSDVPTVTVSTVAATSREDNNAALRLLFGGSNQNLCDDHSRPPDAVGSKAVALRAFEGRLRHSQGTGYHPEATHHEVALPQDPMQALVLGIHQRRGEKELDYLVALRLLQRRQEEKRLLAYENLLRRRPWGLADVLMTSVDVGVTGPLLLGNSQTTPWRCLE